MRVETDDEVHRVDNRWLGPPGAYVGFQARYVAWFLFFVFFLAVFAVGKTLAGIGVWTFLWSGLIAVALTRAAAALISKERTLLAVATDVAREISAPREPTGTEGGAASARTVRIRPTRPRPKQTPTPAAPAPETGQHPPATTSKEHSSWLRRN